MSAPQQTLAFILRKVDYGEKDVIVTLFGRDTGKFAAMAKAARASKRRFGGGLQPMRRLHVDYRPPKSEDGLAFLNEIDVDEDYPELESDYDCITIASYVTELVRSIVQDNQPEPELFDMLADFYRRLPGVGAELLGEEVFLHHFELSLLAQHGAAPSLERCFRCGKPAEHFDKLRCARSGAGLICKSCVRSGEATGILASKTYAILTYLLLPEGEAPTALGNQAAMEQARRVIWSSFEAILDRPLKSKPMLDLLLESAHDATENDDDRRE